MKRVMILGVTGQDGSYLAEHLLKQGDCNVVGVARRSSTGNMKNIQGILNHENFALESGELIDIANFHKLFLEYSPHVIYNEADQDHVGYSYELPGYSYDVTGSTVGKMLDVVNSLSSDTKFFQPLSATMFGHAPAPQNEDTRFHPQSPYAVAKVFAYYVCQYYRNVHDMHVSTAILYNHESKRRDEKYLLHKIAASAVRIANGEQEALSLGDITQLVDIGYAPEYVTYFPKIMNLDHPGDWVLSTTLPRTISTLCEWAFELVGIENWPEKITHNKNFDYPGKPQTLVGNSIKAATDFGFQPRMDSLDVIEILVKHYTRNGL
jgi:GDPmannose 4,6-dehydratase